MDQLKPLITQNSITRVDANTEATLQQNLRLNWRNLNSGVLTLVSDSDLVLSIILSLSLSLCRLWHSAGLGKDADVIVFGGTRDFTVLMDSVCTGAEKSPLGASDIERIALYNVTWCFSYVCL